MMNWEMWQSMLWIDEHLTLNIYSMKTLATIFFLAGAISPSFGQVVSNVNWQLEGNERIIITYDLAKVDNVIYFDVSVKAKIDDKIIEAKALSGDVGTYVKIGTNKQIVWNLFEDISALNGKLSVEVLAFNPVPAVSPLSVTANTSDSSQIEKLPGPRIPFWAGMGGIGVTGVGLLTAGIKGAGESQDLYKVYKEHRIESSDIYSEIGSTRDEVYEEANKKHKNATLLQVAGAAVFVAAGVMILNRMIQAKKIERRGLAVRPHMMLNPESAMSRARFSTGLTVQYRLR
jgi:hypothetical protein